MSKPPPTEQVLQNLAIRTFQKRDQADVSRLYHEGLLTGQLASNDTGADIENIRAAYFDDDRHHLWVAEVDGRVRGMIGVGSDDDHTAEIRRLRVDPDFQHTPIARRLLETALNHCRHHGFLKIVLDTHFQHNAAVDLFDYVGFQHTRTRSIQGKDLLEFYLDLYREPADKNRAPDDTP